MKPQSIQHYTWSDPGGLLQLVWACGAGKITQHSLDKVNPAFPFSALDFGRKLEMESYCAVCLYCLYAVYLTIYIFTFTQYDCFLSE